MIRRTLVVLLVTAGTAGCGDIDADAVRRQVQTPAVDRAAENLASFDRADLRRAAARSLGGVKNASRISCPGKITLSGAVPSTTCTVTLKRSGAQYRVVVRYVPGVGIAPGIPQRIR